MEPCVWRAFYYVINKFKAVSEELKKLNVAFWYDSGVDWDDSNCIACGRHDNIMCEIFCIGQIGIKTHYFNDCKLFGLKCFNL